MAAVRAGTLACAGTCCFRRSVNPRTAATLCLTADGDSPEMEAIMLKIVPDPPHLLHSLEDTLMMAADYALCAEVVAQQAMLMQPKSPVSLLIMTSMHELETLRKLLEAALIQIQKPADPQTLH
ncbi:hypothetical protein D3C78_673420 [compost metagenome]